MTSLNYLFEASYVLKPLSVINIGCALFHLIIIGIGQHAFWSLTNPGNGRTVYYVLTIDTDVLLYLSCRMARLMLQIAL